MTERGHRGSDGTDYIRSLRVNARRTKDGAPQKKKKNLSQLKHKKKARLPMGKRERDGLELGVRWAL